MWILFISSIPFTNHPTYRKIEGQQMIVTIERSDSQRVIKRLTNAQALDILNIRQLAKLFNISESTVHWRMKEQKMTLEDALTTPLQSK